MIPLVAHAGCPRCGGVLQVDGASRRVDCPYCGAPLLLDNPGHVPRFVLPHRVDARGARDALRRALAHGEVLPEARAAAESAEISLFYVPFYELEARVLGRFRMRTGVRKERGGQAIQGPDGETTYVDFDGAPITAERYYKGQDVDDYDTRVRMHEFYRAGPATRLEGWGLDVADVKKLREAAGTPRHFDPIAAQAEAPVFSPDRSRDAFVKDAEAAFDTSVADWEVDLGERRLQVLYLPVWRARFRCEKRDYALNIEAVTGGVLGGAAPQAHARGTLAMLLVAGYLALPIAKVLKNIEYFGEIMAVFGGSVGPFFLFLAPVLALFPLAYAWSEFRYRGEVVFRGDGAEVVKLAIPPKTALDKLLDQTMEALQNIARDMEEGFDRKSSW